MAFICSIFGKYIKSSCLDFNHIKLYLQKSEQTHLDDEDLVHVGEEVLSKGVDWPYRG